MLAHAPLFDWDGTRRALLLTVAIVTIVSAGVLPGAGLAAWRWFGTAWNRRICYRRTALTTQLVKT